MAIFSKAFLLSSLATFLPNLVLGQFPSQPQVTQLANGITTSVTHLNQTHFQLTFNTPAQSSKGYMALSFSTGACGNAHKAGTEVMMAWFNTAGAGNVVDGTMNGFAVQQDPQQNWQVVAVAPGKVTVNRMLNTGDNADVVVNPAGGYCVGWAVDGGAAGSAPLRVKHDSKGKTTSNTIFKLNAAGNAPTNAPAKAPTGPSPGPAPTATPPPTAGASGTQATKLGDGANLGVSYPNATHVKVNLQYTDAAGYLAFSLAKGQCGDVHAASDVLMVWFNTAGKANVLDGITDNTFTVTADGQQDWQLLDAAAQGTTVTINAVRQANTNTRRDLPIIPGTTYCLGWAKSATPSANAPLAVQHDERGKLTSATAFNKVPKSVLI